MMQIGNKKIVITIIIVFFVFNIMCPVWITPYRTFLSSDQYTHLLLYLFVQKEYNKPFTSFWDADSIFNIVDSVSMELQLPDKLLYAIILHESHFKWVYRYNKNNSVDIGYCQINSKWHLKSNLEKGRDIYTKRGNIEAGAEYLAYAIKRFGLENGIIVYNRGHVVKDSLAYAYKNQVLRIYNKL